MKEFLLIEAGAFSTMYTTQHYASDIMEKFANSVDRAFVVDFLDKSSIGSYTRVYLKTNVQTVIVRIA
jgi:hypothetical protein